MKNTFSALAAFLLIALAIPQPARAGFSLGDAANFAVLYQGTAQLQINTFNITGNVGVGPSATMHLAGGADITGTIYFQGSTGFSTSGTNTFGGPVFNSTTGTKPFNVQDALSTIDSLSTSVGGETAANIAINGTQTINASSGTLDASGNRVFNVTSYNENDGKLLTINGDGDGSVPGSSENVVINLPSGTNLNLGGDVKLTGGLTPDQVLWNFTSSKALSLGNNASSFPLPNAFMGVILAPNATVTVQNSNLDGRIFGGSANNMQIVSGGNIVAPSTPTPEPKSLLLTGLMGLAIAFAASRTRTLSRQ